MEPFKRRCPFCGDAAELAMSASATPTVSYACKACSRTFALVPANLRKVLVAVFIMSALLVAAGGWALAMDVGGWQDAKALRLVVAGLVLLVGSVVMLGRDALQRRAAPVVSRF